MVINGYTMNSLSRKPDREDKSNKEKSISDNKLNLKSVSSKP